MRDAVVFALYLWIVVSAVALAAQIIRRFARSRATPPPVAVGRLAPHLAAQADDALAHIDLDAPPPPVGRTEQPAPSVIDLSTPSPAPNRRSLADLLAGVELPQGLRPVAPAGPVTADDTVYLLTDRAPAEVVGPAVADELERLGYSLEAVDPSTLVASRGADVLTLTMVLDPRSLTEHGAALFPHATAADVLVTIAVGAVTHFR